MKDVSIKEGETLTLQCKISNPKATAVWMKDGKPISGLLRADVRQDGQHHKLTISNAELSDMGKYSIDFNDGELVLDSNVEVKGML